MHPIAKVSKQVNRKCPPRNVTVQLSAPYTDRGPSNSPPQNFHVWNSRCQHGYCRQRSTISFLSEAGLLVYFSFCVLNTTLLPSNYYICVSVLEVGRCWYL